MYTCIMQIITTTELRTKSKELVKTLKQGKSVSLIHRSKVIGILKPEVEIKKPLVLDQLKQIELLLTQIRPKKLIPQSKRDIVYRKNLEEKYKQIL